VLSFSYATVWSIAVLLGVTLLLIGISEFFIAGFVPVWRWLHALLGLGAVAAGVLALAWPGETFVIAAAIIGWYLLFRGILDIIASLITRADEDLWWLRLLAGAVEVGIGFWAIGYPGRSLVLLAVWVGVAALVKGFTDMAMAFQLRSLK